MADKPINETPIFLPSGEVHLSVEQKVQRAEKQLLLAAQHVGQLNDQNPLSVALMMVNTSLTILESVSQQPDGIQYARVCYADILKSVTNYAASAGFLPNTKPAGGAKPVNNSGKTKH